MHKGRLPIDKPLPNTESYTGADLTQYQQPQAPILSMEQKRKQAEQLITNAELQGMPKERANLLRRKYGMATPGAKPDTLKEGDRTYYTTGPRTGQRVFPSAPGKEATVPEKKFKQAQSLKKVRQDVIAEGFKGSIDVKGKKGKKGEFRFDRMKTDEFEKFKTFLAEKGYEPIATYTTKGPNGWDIISIRPIAGAQAPANVEGDRQRDLEFTAQQHGITVEEVLRRLGGR